MMQTSILPNFYSFTYLLMSLSRVKVKLMVHFLEKKPISYSWVMLWLLRYSELQLLTQSECISCTRVKT